MEGIVLQLAEKRIWDSDINDKREGFYYIGGGNMEQINFQRSVEIRHKVDVFVAGGGPAGVAAAVSAARNGAHVFLAEKSQCFGGMGTIAKVPAFMRFSDGVHFLAGGIGKEIFDKVYGKDTPFDEIEFAIDTEKLKIVYDELITESGIDFSFESTVISVESVQGKLKYAVIQGKENLFAVEAKIFVDATGDGTVCCWAGADSKKGDENGDMMPGTLCTQWANIDWSRAVVELGKDPDNRMLEQAFRDKIFTVEDRALSGMWKHEHGIGGGNIGHVFGVDGTDERSITMGIIDARKRMPEYQTYYNTYLPGYEKAKMIATADVLGIRETRRIICEYNMTLEDYLHQADFEDEIGRYCYPVDVHSSRPDGETKYPNLYEKGYETGKSYGIPFRALLPKKTENVIVAGRSIGAEREMMGSVRVMPACYITGQAAGTAAAMAAIKGISLRELDVYELQKKLVDTGVYLPHFIA